MINFNKPKIEFFFKRRIFRIKSLGLDMVAGRAPRPVSKNEGDEPVAPLLVRRIPAREFLFQETFFQADLEKEHQCEQHVSRDLGYRWVRGRHCSEEEEYSGVHRVAQEPVGAGLDQFSPVSDVRLHVEPFQAHDFDSPKAQTEACALKKQ